MLSLRKLSGRLRASLWFVPAVAAVIAFAAAEVLLLVDRAISKKHDAWFLFNGSVDGARELLSTIASSMMAFIGVVFSITILVLQLASSQFSPRILRTFLEDRVTKVAMAAFVSTFVFSLGVLPEVRGEFADHERFVPGLSVYAALVLVLVSVGVFIHYIDHMAHAIRAIRIIKRIGADTRQALESMYPEPILSGPEEPMELPTDPPTVVECHDAPGGVLSMVNEEDLMGVAARTQAIVALVPAPGQFVPQGSPLFRIWCRAEAPPHTRTIKQAIVIAQERTLHQDPAFGFRQLVDIAERALSPGVNDPSTAVQVLDELHDLLRLLVRRHFPSPHRVDDDGELRLILPRPSWPDYVQLALNEIRQYGSPSLQVASRMRALIEDCITVAAAERRGCLEEQLRLLDEATAREIPSEDERRFVRDPHV